MIDFDAGLVFLQWATGVLAFLWVTTRRRQVSLGYGWIMRATGAVLALIAFGVGVAFSPFIVRDIASAGVAIAAFAAFVQSFQRRVVGVEHQRQLVEARSARVAEMTGIDRPAKEKATGREFDPRLDLVAPLIGAVGIVVAATQLGGPVWLALGRVVAGTLFLGAVSDAMMLGHWYLVQPGLERGPLEQLVRWTGLTWFPVVALLLVPTGIVSVLNGDIEDGWGGMLGWFWVACAVTTIVLVLVTRAALKGRQYSSVMAATGLLYLAILTAFGTDLVGRALLS